MPLRIAQAANAESVWNEMLIEYEHFLTGPGAQNWNRSNFHYRRPRNDQFLQLKTGSTLKVWIHYISSGHYYVYLLGTAEDGGQVKISVGDLRN
jgi:hypothetical protein